MFINKRKRIFNKVVKELEHINLYVAESIEHRHNRTGNFSYELYDGVGKVGDVILLDRGIVFPEHILVFVHDINYLSQVRRVLEKFDKTIGIGDAVPSTPYRAFRLYV